MYMRQRTTCQKTEVRAYRNDKENADVVCRKTTTTYQKEVVQYENCKCVGSSASRDALAALPSNSTTNHYGNALVPKASARPSSATRTASAHRPVTAIELLTAVRSSSAVKTSSVARPSSATSGKISSVSRPVSTHDRVFLIKPSATARIAPVARPASSTVRSQAVPRLALPSNVASVARLTSTKALLNKSSPATWRPPAASTIKQSPAVRSKATPKLPLPSNLASVAWPTSIKDLDFLAKPSSSVLSRISVAKQASAFTRQSPIVRSRATPRPISSSTIVQTNSTSELPSTFYSIDSTQPSSVKSNSSSSTALTSYASAQEAIKKSIVETSARTRRSSSRESIESKQVTHRNYYNENNDEVFVDGRDHYINYYPGVQEIKAGNTPSFSSTSSSTKYLSIQSNPRNLHSANGVIKAEKRNLIRKLSERSRSSSSSDFYIYIYNAEYMTDYYKYMLHNEWMFLLKKNALAKNNVNINRRMANVDWLVCVQDIMNLTETVLLSAIRVFDYILASTTVSEKSYTLIAIVALWICNKYYGHKTITLTKITALCSGNYSERQITKMEIFVLNTLKFRLNIQEPLTFLFYYLKLFSNDHTKFLQHACCYIFESIALTPDYSFTAPSLLACTSFYLILSLTNTSTTSFLNYISNQYDINTIKQYSKQLVKYVQETKTLPYQNTYEKYKKRNVSYLFS